jgi:predicted ATP-grasp superfamily ATP-dependent carboligase
MARVLVLDGYTFSALAIVRSLGRLGHEVYVASSEPRAIAGASRFAGRTSRSPSAAECPELFVQWVADKVHEEKIDALFWSTSATTLAIDKFRRYLNPSLLRDLPSSDSVSLVYDKLRTFRMARDVGMPIPRTETWDEVDIESLAAGATFPCVIKPRHSCVFLDGQIVGCGSHRYIYDKNAFIGAAKLWDRRFPSPLVQEMIPGFGFGVFILMHEGEAVASFAHQRIREANPLGASSSFRVSIDLPDDAYASAVRLLKAMKWNGVAMVEFKRDARDGTPKLMEINGRFWYSLALCLQAGVDFPALLLQLKLGEGVDVKEGYRTGVGTHWVGGELMHVYKVLKGKPADYNGDYPGRAETLYKLGRDFLKHPWHDLPDLLHGGRDYFLLDKE